MSLINWITSRHKKAQFNELERFKDQPETIQLKLLKKVIKKNRHTDFGKQYHFNRIKTYEDYKKFVPIRTAKEYQADLDRVYEGNHLALCAEKPFFFAMTAGSTGQYKHIPVTPSLKRDVNKGTLSYLHLFETACPEAKNAPIQFLIGSGEGGKSPANIPKGFVSGFHYKNLPKALRSRFIIPYWVFTIEDMQDRFYSIVRFMADRPDLAAIASMTPQHICNLANTALEHHDRLAKDLSQASLTLLNTPTEQIPNTQFTPCEDRAQLFLEAVAAGDKPASMQALFPSLGYFGTWISANMSYGLEDLNHTFGEKTIFEMPSSASEGLFVVPYKINQAGGISATTCHFFEFIPEDELDTVNPNTYMVNELNLNQRYYLVLTNSAGLYRYNMEDLFEVIDYWGKTPVLKFIAKKARQVSIANERIDESDVVIAMQACRHYFTEAPKHFLLLPNKHNYYQLVLDTTPNEPDEFIQHFDRQLQQNAKAYEHYREGGVLTCVKLDVFSDPVVNGKTPLAAFVDSVQFRSNLPSGQYKPIHISNSMTLFDEFFQPYLNEESRSKSIESTIN